MQVVSFKTDQAPFPGKATEGIRRAAEQKNASESALGYWENEDGRTVSIYAPARIKDAL